MGKLPPADYSEYISIGDHSNGTCFSNHSAKIKMKLSKVIRATFLLVVVSLLLPALHTNLQAQDISKRALEHKDYDHWNTLGQTTLSNDGKWILYSISSGKTDGNNILKIRKIGASKEYTVVGGAEGRFTFDSRFAIFRIQPDKAKVKQLRKDKTKSEDMPVDQHQILDLKNGERTSLERIKSIGLPEKNSDWIAIHKMKPAEPKPVQEKPSSINETYEITEEGLQRPEKKPKLKKREELVEPELEEKEEKKKNPTKNTPESKAEGKSKSGSEAGADDDKKKRDKAPGTTLVLRNLRNGEERSFPDAMSYQFSKFGDSFAWTTSVKHDDKKNGSAPDKDADAKDNKKKSDGDKKQDEEPKTLDRVYVFDLKKMTQTEIFAGKCNFKRLEFNDAGSQLAFLADNDDFEADTPAFALYHWKSGQKEAKKIADENSSGVPNEWWVSSSANLTFSEDDRRLYFSTAPVPESVVEERENAEKKKNGKKVKDENDEPKAKLDLWHWQDPLLQPQQLLQAEAERRRSYRAVYDLKRRRFFNSQPRKCQMSKLTVGAVRMLLSQTQTGATEK